MDRRAETLGDFQAIASIRSFVGSGRDWEELSSHGWSTTRREQARAFAGEVLAGTDHKDSGVKAVDERTVRVTTPTESPLIPLRMASVNTGVLAPAAFEDEGVNPFGHCTGPFTPVSEQPQQSLTPGSQRGLLGR